LLHSGELDQADPVDPGARLLRLHLSPLAPDTFPSSATIVEQGSLFVSIADDFDWLVSQSVHDIFRFLPLLAPAERPISYCFP